MGKGDKKIKLVSYSPGEQNPPQKKEKENRAKKKKFPKGDLGGSRRRNTTGETNLPSIGRGFVQSFGGRIGKTRNVFVKVLFSRELRTLRGRRKGPGAPRCRNPGLGVAKGLIAQETVPLRGGA